MKYYLIVKKHDNVVLLTGNGRAYNRYHLYNSIREIVEWYGKETDVNQYRERKREIVDRIAKKWDETYRRGTSELNIELPNIIVNITFHI